MKIVFEFKNNVYEIVKLNPNNLNENPEEHERFMNLILDNFENRYVVEDGNSICGV